MSNKVSLWYSIIVLQKRDCMGPPLPPLVKTNMAQFKLNQGLQSLKPIQETYLKSYYPHCFIIYWLSLVCS